MDEGKVVSVGRGEQINGEEVLVMVLVAQMVLEDVVVEIVVITVVVELPAVEMVVRPVAMMTCDAVSLESCSC